MIDTSRNALIGTQPGKRVKPAAYHDVLHPEPVITWANQTIAMGSVRSVSIPLWMSDRRDSRLCHIHTLGYTGLLTRSHHFGGGGSRNKVLRGEAPGELYVSINSKHMCERTEYTRTDD